MQSNDRMQNKRKLNNGKFCILHFALCIFLLLSLTACGYNELPEETQTLVIPSDSAEEQTVTAKALLVGKTKLSLQKGISYYLFVPEESGTYDFAVTKGNATVGYYGASTFVRSENIAENTRDAGFTLSISEQMLGTDVVLGVTARADTEAVIKLTRTGDAEKTVEDIPAVEYQNIHAPKEYTVPDGVLLYDFRINSAEGYHLVYSEADGFYHLDSADGPLVYAVLGKTPRISGLFDSFETMMVNRGIVCTFTDADGNITDCEDFTYAMDAYIDAMDERKGVYPLTEDLKYMIGRIGENWGWFDETSPGYLFVDDEGNKIEGLNKDILWMFCLQYEVTNEMQN